MSGKRFFKPEREEKGLTGINFKKVFIFIGMVALIVAVVIVINYFTKYRKDEETDSKVEIQVSQSQADNKKMPKTYEGYKVLGKITIERIGVESYILDSTEDKAMDKSAVKLYGKNLNEEGNFCIAGHNYDEIFAGLDELVVGDEFYIESIDGVIQDYKVTEKLEVDPTDLTVLMPIEDKIQVTLITCKKEGTQRLVIKAERIDIEVEALEDNTSDEV